MSSSKYLGTVTAVTVMLSVIFTSVLAFFSGSEGIVQAMSSSVNMPYAEQFDPFEVMEIEISIDDEDWQTMLDDPLAEEYKHCDVTVNGTEYADAAIRTKGNTSLSQVASSNSDRYSFKIEFDHYDKNKSFAGLDKLVLNNLFSDATYVKEYIAYDIFRYIGVETPYYAFASITVNGESFGCYLALEALEDSFLERAYYGSGQLYKPESSMAGGGGMKHGEPFQMEERPQVEERPQMEERSQTGELPHMEERGDHPPTEGHPEMGEMKESMEFPEGRDIWPGMGESGGGSDLVYTDDEIDSYSDIFENASFDPSDADKKRVITALEKLGEGQELEKYIDVDACLRYFAAQTFIVNMDSYYSNLKHNYYLYENNGQLTILPWDLNLAFGGFQNGDADEAVNGAIDTPMGGKLEESRPLFGKLMEVPEYKELYHDYLNEIVEGYVNSGQFTGTLSKIKEKISPYVKTDTTAFYSYDEYEEAIEMLKAFVLLRAESVSKQMEGEIPSASNERGPDTALVDASCIDLKIMGVQGGDGYGGKGSREGNMF